jgi:hypothetical protein
MSRNRKPARCGMTRNGAVVRGPGNFPSNTWTRMAMLGTTAVPDTAPEQLYPLQPEVLPNTSISVTKSNRVPFRLSCGHAGGAYSYHCALTRLTCHMQHHPYLCSNTYNLQAC